MDLMVTEDTVQDRNQMASFAAQARQLTRIERDSGQESATLVVGSEEYPTPIPIVERNGQWRFDTREGREEILYRRVGRNELGRHRSVSRVRRGPVGVCLREARRRDREPVRAAHDQYAREAGRVGMESRRRNLARARGRSGRPGAQADYGITGVKTFIVSHAGVIYEKDLGPTTVEQFRAMERYSPDSTWRPVQEP